MQRILIIGPPGAGKSTLARALGARLNLPVVHLDRLYWQPGWVAADRVTFKDRVNRAVTADRWVMDGNYSDTYDLRFPRADTVIHLDFSTPISLYRILRRMLTGHGRVRSDGPDGCPERFDWPFIRWTVTFHRMRRPRIISTIAPYHGSVNAITLANVREIERFLAELDGGA